ncbi:MAG: alpha/beta hydrolase [Bacteroidales bacterium]|nr:alpha/beta hydrolase [Bacteroidales bacterium]
MPFYKTTTADIYYEVHGAGTPLLMIAGMSSDSKSWQFILEELKKEHTIILFDNRGCGRTVYEGCFGLETIADDAIELLDFLGFDKADIAGHSMGGMIAQELVLKYPERVRRLVLASSSPRLSQKTKYILDELSKKWEDGCDMADWFRIMFGNLFTQKSLSNKKFMDAVLIFACAYPYPQTLQGFKDQVAAITGFDASGRIHQITHHTLIISGQEDILITPNESRVLTAMGGRNEFIIIENAAHSIHAENPKGFTAALLRFV